MIRDRIRRYLAGQWHQDLLPLLLFLCLPLLSFPELFFQERTLYRGDLTWIHYPLRVFAAEQWRSGQVPLWNPYVLSGFPLLAEGQVGVLYPLNALFLLPMPAYRALTLFVTLHLTLAATFTYILARSLGINRAGATLAGLSFGFGGFLMAQITHPNIMTGGVWLPLIFCFFVYALRSQRWLIALLGCIPLALQILTAQPQVVFYTAILLVGYALYQTGRLVVTPSANHSRFKSLMLIWIKLALMLGSGLLLAAPQLLPTWELQSLSVRQEGLGYDQIVFISLSPAHWLTLVLPTLFGNNVTTSYQGSEGNFEETYVYIGILPLIMLPFSWRARRQPEVIFLWVTAIVGVLLALGGFTPLYRVLQYLPGFNLFRVPARWSLLVNFALAILAAYGFMAFSQRPAGRRFQAGLLGLWLFILVTLLGAWYFQEPLSQWVETWPSYYGFRQALRLLLRRGLFEVTNAYENRIFLEPLSWWVLPAVALLSRLGLGAMLLLAYAARRLPQTAFSIAVIGLVAGDMALAGGSTINRLEWADLWNQLSGGARYVFETEPEQVARLFSLASGEEEDIVAGLGQYFPSVHHVFATSGHASPLRLAQYDAVIQSIHPVVALSLTGTRFVLSPAPLGADAQSVFSLVYQDKQWYVYENPAALPRAFITRRVVVAASAAEAFTYLQNSVFEPASPIVLETSEPLPPLAEEVGLEDKLHFSRYTPTAVELQANLADNGFLVLLDNYYPGWHVYVDGQPQKILRANSFARAVYLTKGHHQVQFVYRPASFQIGLGLSAIGLLILLIGSATFCLGYKQQYNDSNY